MKYKTLIKRFEKYAEQEVDIVASKGEVIFFPVGDENTTSKACAAQSKNR